MWKAVFEGIRNEALTSYRRILSLSNLARGIIGYIVIFLVSFLSTQLLHVTNQPIIIGTMFLVSILYWFFVGTLKQPEDVDLYNKELLSEIQYFDSHIDELLGQYKGSFVAIKNHQVIASGDTYEAVSEKIKATPYAKDRCILTKKVEEERPVHFVPVALSAS